MRILVQRKDTGLYFKDIEAWTLDYKEAMDFVSSTSAIDFCMANKLENVHLVLKFEEQRYDIIMPVVPLRPSQDRSDVSRDSRTT